MNCFVLTDNERSLVIDPGMDHEMCLQAVRIGLAELGVNLEKTDFFITHHHLDHFGLIGRLMKKGSMIYASGAEALSVEKIASRAILPILARLLRAMGFPEEDPEEVLPELLGDEYRLVNQWPFCCLEDGAVIERGGRRFRCIVAPGHSPGHMCLHQADSSLLIAGDVFSPVLQFFSGAGNPLRDQLDSFAELRSLEPRVVLPGHGERSRTRQKQRNDSKRISGTGARASQTPFGAAAWMPTRRRPVLPPAPETRKSGRPCQPYSSSSRPGIALPTCCSLKPRAYSKRRRTPKGWSTRCVTRGDVSDAECPVILSGTGSPREILRPVGRPYGRGK